MLTVGVEDGGVRRHAAEVARRAPMTAALPELPPGLARAVAREIARWVPPLVGVDAADYRQEALLAWWQVQQRYDATRGWARATYGQHRVLGRVHDLRDWATHHGKMHYQRWRDAPSVLPVEREVWLRRHINRLPARWRFVVIRYYWSGWTLQAIGRALGISESRALQLQRKALRALRTRLRATR